MGPGSSRLCPVARRNGHKLKREVSSEHQGKLFYSEDDHMVTQVTIEVVKSGDGPGFQVALFKEQAWAR